MNRRGVALGLGAYLLWGLFPLYFPLMAPAGPLEVLAHRVLWSLAFCALALLVTSLAGRSSSARQLRALARRPRVLVLLVLAAAAIAVNWGVYIAAVSSGHVVEASLGYFINPLVTVALAVLVLRERLRRLQWAAVAIGALAVVVLSAAVGRPPWISLVLAVTFGAYGLLKKQLGASAAGAGTGLDALTGLSAETLVLAVPAALALTVLERTGRGHFTGASPWHPVLLASTGVVTAVPLLLFAAAARRVSLTTTGLLQYLTPVLQLVLGVAVLHERVSPARWAGFATIWAALLVLTADLVLAGRRSRAARRAGSPDPVVV